MDLTANKDHAQIPSDPNTPLKALPNRVTCREQVVDSRASSRHLFGLHHIRLVVLAEVVILAG